MATLQAARAQIRGLPVASAKSWGLNRAIYYAAAKRGFKGGKAPAKPKKYTASFGEFHLGDDKAYKVTAAGTTLFTIGGEGQQPEDFRRQGEERIAGNLQNPWGEALRIVGAVPEPGLEWQQPFYMQVDRPRPDAL